MSQRVMENYANDAIRAFYAQWGDSILQSLTHNPNTTHPAYHLNKAELVPL